MDISKLNELITPSGTMAISNKAKMLKQEGKPVIGFGAGEPDFATPSYVIDDVKKASENPENHKYSGVAGLEVLRNEISRTTNLYSGFNANPNNIVVSNGGKHAIFNTLISILDKDDEVLIPAPYWTTYPEAVKIAGGIPKVITTKSSIFWAFPNIFSPNAAALASLVKITLRCVYFDAMVGTCTLPISKFGGSNIIPE